MKVARAYLRVSTDSRELARQNRVIEGISEVGFYVASIYREKPQEPVLIAPNCCA